jgi:hypothetical protein
MAASAPGSALSGKRDDDKIKKDAKITQGLHLLAISLDDFTVEGFSVPGLITKLAGPAVDHKPAAPQRQHQADRSHAEEVKVLIDRFERCRA